MVEASEDSTTGRWTTDEWRTAAHAWIHARLEERGTTVTGPIEQPHVQPWATVLRVPTEHGTVWFKANAGTQAYEAGAVEVLARQRPDAVPAVLAADETRSWLLLADGGTRLRELVEAEHDLGRWTDVLRRYAGLQLDLAGEVDTLIARGVPDYRLAGLPERYAEVVDDCEELVPDERRRLQQLAPWVADACAELSRLGVPETIQHDDLHDGQVFWRDGRYLFFDWGDACVSHPFFTMSVTLEGVLSWGLEDRQDSVDVTPFRDAYLEAFTAYAPRPLLEAAFPPALRLGWICRAFNYQAMKEALGPAHRAEYGEAVAVRLRMFLAGL